MSNNTFNVYRVHLFSGKIRGNKVKLMMIKYEAIQKNAET